MDRALLPGHKSGMLDSAVRVQSGRRPKIKKKEANEGADIVQTSSSASDPPPSLSLSRPSTLPPSNPRVLYRQNGNPLERFASLLLPWNLLESLRLHQEATFSSFSHALPPPPPISTTTTTAATTNTSTSSELQPIPINFDSPLHYYSVWEPLVMEEIKVHHPPPTNYPYIIFHSSHIYIYIYIFVYGTSSNI